MTMRFEHEFTVPVPVEQAWAVLLDVERVAPCLPGAALESVEGDSFTGRLKVKVGPITVTYRGSAAFEDVDKDTHTAVLKASGKEARGSGTASATVTARLRPEGEETRVSVETSFAVTGRPAQFGRGVMAEVGAKLIDRFAAALADLLAEGSAAEPSARPAEAAGVTGVVAEPAGSAAGPVGGPDQAPVAAPAPAAGSTGTGGSPGEGAGPGEPGGKAHPVRHLTAVPSPGREPLPAGQASAAQDRRQETHPGGTARTSRTPDEEALDLLEVAGVPLLRRAAPAAAVLAGLALLAWLARRVLHARR
ncbi:SRPBCC family protein [Planomonospora corallina]|uniref:SRPBCC family protein n=1 Tax=Planomonospora corallina TaxID=1806052 RepID=A0ABV8I4K2_9ACTN